MSEKLTTKELREGNKIKANDVYQGKIMTFNRFNEDKTVVFFSDGHKWGMGEYLKDCEPVVLTSEILLACGFENKIRGNYYHKEFTKLYVNIDNSIAIHFGNKNGILKLIDYLHELQNIFWILTNQELEFKAELLNGK